jgi:8-oxo-dGTP pyrophosphatase MutT (NUDIX family)
VAAGREVLSAVLDAFEASGPTETADVARLREVLAGGADVWSRSAPLHVTASALVVDAASGRVLLRWHDRMRSWLQVGGHFDPGETDPLAVALREAHEETGLADLRIAPATVARPVQVAIVPVRAAGPEPAHEHADIRYLLVTDVPGTVVAESESAPLRWLPFDDAPGEVAEENLRELLARARRLLGPPDC